MAGLQRSEMSFRRQGSSGLVWDDKLLSGELVQLNQREEVPRQQPKEGSEEHEKAEMREIKTTQTVGSINTIERSRSNGGGGGGRGYRTGKVSPAAEPPSPKLSACGFCAGFGRREDKAAARRKKAGGKRKTR